MDVHLGINRTLPRPPPVQFFRYENAAYGMTFFYLFSLHDAQTILALENGFDIHFKPQDSPITVY